ncbi:hypothetical protein PRIPAC_79750 [Pristionchus pacificus]|uniref:Major sperm protein n=1 Tax=Pristionchus pacificus TaxID=54126 RepID=A0A2A6BH36_PRIPA|nr:hypothetical protein PRIPAC_79750 [Pristionchus pacificus]|eukprot:PDM65210.1 MSP domain-containing protein [Pristionchus pacificus]
MFTSEEYLPTKPLDSPITITNKSAKFAAFKVWSKYPDLFRADPQCGIIPAGGTQTVNINYQNPVKPTVEYYVRVFAALVDKEVLPEEFRAEKTATPKNYDGENFLPVQFRRAAAITPLPKEVVIIPGDKIPLNFECKPIGAEPAYSVMTITNNHPQKNLTGSVIPTGSQIFNVKWRSGVLRPGKSAHLPCMFTNLKEEKEEHWFLTFVVFIDSTTLPDDFRKRIAPPFVYDGARAIEITFSKSTSTEPSPYHLKWQALFTKKATVPSAEKAASAEKTEDGGGPPSQTGAPTVTDADNPAPVPAPVPVPAAAPTTTAA